MNTLLFCVFTFRVDCEMYSFFCEWKVLLFGRRRTIGFIQDKHYDLVLHSKCKNAHVLFISTMICFALFFWWQEWQVLDSVTGLGHFQHRFWLFDNASLLSWRIGEQLFVNQLSSLSLKAYCYLCHSRDMFSKEGPVFWWNLWLMKVDVFIFVFLYKKWQHLCWMGFL